MNSLNSFNKIIMELDLLEKYGMVWGCHGLFISLEKSYLEFSIPPIAFHVKLQSRNFLILLSVILQLASCKKTFMDSSVDRKLESTFLFYM